MPTIGYTTIAGASFPNGGSGERVTATTRAAERYTAVTGDVVTKLWYYGGNSGTVELAVYEFSGGVPTNLVGTGTVTVPASAGWASTDVSFALTAGTVYVAALDQFGSGAPTVYSDSGAGAGATSQATATSFPSTWTENTTFDFIVTFYAEVTSGGASDPPAPLWSYRSPILRR